MQWEKLQQENPHTLYPSLQMLAWLIYHANDQMKHDYEYIETMYGILFSKTQMTYTH